MDHENLQASILDRLIDNEPEVSFEPVQFRLLDMRQIKARVIRDLENLLNTRRLADPPDAEFSELNRTRCSSTAFKDYTSLKPQERIRAQAPAPGHREGHRPVRAQAEKRQGAAGARPEGPQPQVQDQCHARHRAREGTGAVRHLLRHQPERVHDYEIGTINGRHPSPIL
ncbi:MAG: hypothetical protein MZV70_53510 [Desulfobacterales bacterium]|nr:hypothetical protein [Desulfobacterales bacterium]